MFVLDRYVCTQRVDYQTCSHTKRRVSAHFLSYELNSMRNVKHMTPYLTPNFLQTIRNDVQPQDFLTCETLLIMQLLTYKDVSVRKLSHKRACPRATCHIISYVLSRPPCFHTLCRLRDVFMCVFAHYKDLSLHTFRIRKTCTWVTFNTWHPVCHIIPHRCTWNEIQPYDF